MKKMSFRLFISLFSLFILAGCCSASSEPPRVSILGDSYSTFKGWIPEGNAVYYPRGARNDVTKAEECWWHLVTEAIGGTLEKNESWSGSTICNTGYKGKDFSKFSFVTRADRLGDPTLILVCGGTNDSWANAPIGDYKWGDWTKEELYSFRPAMAKLLADLKTLYPKARIFFILNSQLKAEINDSVHEICTHYQIPCIDLKDIDKQSGHPSVKGMKAFADQVVAAVGR